MTKNPIKQRGASWLCRPQSKLGAPGLIVFIILANTIIPFSIDMYTPAVPSLPVYFDTTEWMVNFTLMGFFLFLTVASLLFGPISDRFGRKPVLVGSLVTYTAGGILCAIAPSIVTLIGGILLQFFSWRASFVALAIFGAICLTFAVLFEESLPADERSEGGILATLGGLVTVGRNRAFMVLLGAVALFNVAFSAYLAVGSYIYADFFGTTPQQYTYFFAVTAAFTALGPFIWIKARAKVTPRLFTHIMIALGFVSAAALLIVGQSSVFAFCGALVIFATIQSAIRPYTTNILLSQQKGDTGSASSLIGFTISIFGVIGMSVIVAP